MPFGINPVTGMPGPAPSPSRDGDKKQARQRINVEVRSGRRSHPNTIPCADCGHVWQKGERRHEYDHYLGYEAKNHYDVQSVCTFCHANRDNAKAKQQCCSRGHAFTAENTYLKQNGTRSCRTCMRLWDKNRKPRGSEYWRAINAQRRNQNG